MAASKLTLEIGKSLIGFLSDPTVRKHFEGEDFDWIYDNLSKDKRYDADTEYALVKTLGYLLLKNGANPSEMLATMTSIPTNWMAENMLIKSIVVPEGMSRIPENGFYDCEKLASVKLPNSLNSIELDAFSLCESLTEIIITDAVTLLGYRCFYGCPKLSKITLPRSLRNIRSQAFDGCTSLTEVNLPGSVISMDDYCFDDFNNKRPLTINYDGTKAKFNEINKSPSWAGYRKVTVNCSDGKIISQYNGY